MSRKLREYVGDMSRSLPAVVDSLESIFGRMERIGGPSRVYTLDTNQDAAFYTVGTGGSAVGLAWSSDNLVNTIFWWDHFNFAAPDYELDLPRGVDIERILPAIKNAVIHKHMGKFEA